MLNSYMYEETSNIFANHLIDVMSCCNHSHTLYPGRDIVILEVLPTSWCRCQESSIGQKLASGQVETNYE